MLYYAVRFLFFAIVATICIILIVKSSLKNKNRAIAICIAISICLLYISSLIPFENLFYTFKTPQEAFHYSQIGTIYDIDYGSDSCNVYFKTYDNKNSWKIFVKKGDGYKLGYYPSLQTYDRGITSNGFSYWISKAKDSNDYYINCHFISEYDVVFTDTNDSSFTYEIIDLPATDDKMTTAHAYIGSPDENYKLFINDKQAYPQIE